MLKLLLSFVGLVALAQSVQIGSWHPTELSDELLDVTKWSLVQLPQFTGLQGQHEFSGMQDPEIQIAGGVNYRFKLTVHVGTEVKINIHIY